MKTKVLQFKVILRQDEDGYFVASAPALPGCHTQGKTYEEAIKNAKEAIELCLEEAKENAAYHDQIDWEEAKGRRERFVGITEVPIRFNFSS